MYIMIASNKHYVHIPPHLRPPIPQHHFKAARCALRLGLFSALGQWGKSTNSQCHL